MVFWPFELPRAVVALVVYQRPKCDARVPFLAYVSCRAFAFNLNSRTIAVAVLSKKCATAHAPIVKKTG